MEVVVKNGQVHARLKNLLFSKCYRTRLAQASQPSISFVIAYSFVRPDGVAAATTAPFGQGGKV